MDILQHRLVPKHEVLSKQEKEEILKKFNVRPEQLPKIFMTDPVVKCLKAKPGDVIKITRDSPTAGKSFYYRIVVED
jgi:DNA-directed RNA polymerase subunit H